jgi:hypothetical protein
MTSFDQLMPSDIDAGILAHGEFEDVFDIKKGMRENISIRKELLNTIYSIRSNVVHEGVGFRHGMFMENLGTEATRRMLLDRFAEMVIIKFLQTPFVSIVGHPAHEVP